MRRVVGHWGYRWKSDAYKDKSDMALHNSSHFRLLSSPFIGFSIFNILSGTHDQALISHCISLFMYLIASSWPS